MITRKTLTVWAEIFVASLVLGGLNLLTPHDPGFLSLYYTPYIALGLVFAAAYGAAYGLSSLAVSAVIVVGVYPFVADLIVPDFTTKAFWSTQADAAYIPVPAGIAVTFVVGFIRTVSLQSQQDLKSRVADLSRENWLLRQKSKALVTVNRELEERVSGQQDAVTALDEQLQKLDTSDVNRALSVLLETVQIFTGASKASVWRFHEGSHELRTAATVGWEEDDRSRGSLPVDGTLEGWAFRNNTVFSVRMVLQHENLKQMDTGRNIVTVPLVIGRRVWGILNIEEMPFEKYSLYTERLLRIIANLAEHSIEAAVSYESILRKEEVDDSTGLPLFSQFYLLTEEEARRSGGQKSSFSIVILEIVNYSVVVKEYGEEDAKQVVRRLADELQRLSSNRAHVFHYKNESQIALLYPNLDYDGVSLFCLETMEQILTGDWQVGGERTAVDAIVGFAVYEGEEPQELLEKAEHLLEMQRE